MYDLTGFLGLNLMFLGMFSIIGFVNLNDKLYLSVSLSALSFAFIDFLKYKIGIGSKFSKKNRIYYLFIILQLIGIGSIIIIPYIPGNIPSQFANISNDISVITMGVFITLYYMKHTENILKVYKEKAELQHKLNKAYDFIEKNEDKYNNLEIGNK